MRTPVALPARKGHTPAEVAGFHADRDKELAKTREALDHVINASGLPPRVIEVLRVGAPVLLEAASVLERALHPESPGGPALTDEDLSRIARGAGRELEHRLDAELTPLVTHWRPVTNATADGSPVPADAPPTPTIDPAMTDLSKATIVPVPSPGPPPFGASPVPTPPPKAA
jgi:hypothetical protein